MAPLATITGATPGLAAASPRGLALRHRMAAAGPRDSTTDATVTSGLFGVKGTLFNKVEVDLGARAEKYRYIEMGKNYIEPIAFFKALIAKEKAIATAPVVPADDAPAAAAPTHDDAQAAAIETARLAAKEKPVV
jgi:hypothetical protein